MVDHTCYTVWASLTRARADSGICLTLRSLLNYIILCIWVYKGFKCLSTIFKKSWSRVKVVGAQMTMVFYWFHDIWGYIVSLWWSILVYTRHANRNPCSIKTSVLCCAVSPRFEHWHLLVRPCFLKIRCTHYLTVDQIRIHVIVGELVSLLKLVL